MPSPAPHVARRRTALASTRTDTGCCCGRSKVVAALLMMLIIVLLLGGVVSRYVFSQPDRLDRRGGVARVHLAGDDRRGDRDAPQRAPAADAVPRQAAAARARLRPRVRAGGGRGVPRRAWCTRPASTSRRKMVDHHARARHPQHASASRRSPSASLAMLAIVLVYACAHGSKPHLLGGRGCWSAALAAAVQLAVAAAGAARRC